jgi:hypothetical protein
VSTLIIKALKRLDWRVETGKFIIENYNSIKEISRDEINVLTAILIFPQRFWRLANRYYYREAGWSEATFMKKMKEIVGERENYMNFISNIGDIF